jgi:hypothetical protein
MSTGAASPRKTLTDCRLVVIETAIDLSQSFARSIRVNFDHRFKDRDAG